MSDEASRRAVKEVTVQALKEKQEAIRVELRELESEEKVRTYKAMLAQFAVLGDAVKGAEVELAHANVSARPAAPPPLHGSVRGPRPDLGDVLEKVRHGNGYYNVYKKPYTLMLEEFRARKKARVRMAEVTRWLMQHFSLGDNTARCYPRYAIKRGTALPAKVSTDGRVFTIEFPQPQFSPMPPSPDPDELRKAGVAP